MGLVRLRLLIAASCLAATLVGCGGSGGSNAQALEQCSVIAPTECSADAPADYQAVAPIFAQRCATCHGRVKGGPWPLGTYEDVADWADVVRDELISCAMPPPDSGLGMTNAERLQILSWLRCGYPE